MKRSYMFLKNQQLSTEFDLFLFDHPEVANKIPDGKPHYEFEPGSLMYALMLEFYVRTSKEGFIAMLPFIFPPLKPVYQKANPGVKF